MKIFPHKIYNVKLSSNYKIVAENLKTNTDVTDSLTSTHTNKAFRGQVNEKEFKIISSEIGRGALCVLIGEFLNNEGKLEIRIHKAFKIMLSIIMLYPFIGFAIITYTKGYLQALKFLPILIIGLLIIRLVFIEFGFRFVSKTGINKLTNILSIKELKEL